MMMLRLLMPFTSALLIVLLLAACAATTRAVPIASGHYTFQLRFGEQPAMQGTPLDVTIQGSHITVVNPRPFGPWPAGVLNDGILMWNVNAKQWIIGHKVSDQTAKRVGPCSGGLTVVDLVKKIYWVC